MKKFAMSAFAVCAIAGAASAAQVRLNVQSIGMGGFNPDGVGGLGNVQGGFFNMKVVNAAGANNPLMAGDLSAVHNEFKTFCVERTETISNGNHDYRVNTQSILGGASTNSPQPLAYQTAYLYTQFRAGTLSDIIGGFTLSGSNDGTNDQRRAMQIAIWSFQEQITLGASDGSQAFTWAALLIADANAAVLGAWGSTIGNVRVLNMGGPTGLDTNGDGIPDQYTHGASQDLLVMIPLPHGVGLASAGLLVLGARRRRGL